MRALMIFSTVAVFSFSLVRLGKAQGFMNVPAQQTGVLIGTTCPDFEIQGIEGLKFKHIRVSQLRGQWVVLDFWTKNCSSCITFFPRMNRFYQKFSNQLFYLQIGELDKQKQIKPMFNEFKRKLDLKFPYAFDSVIFKKLGITGVPLILIIDPAGKINAITSIIDESQMQSVLAGKSVRFDKTYDVFSNQLNSAQSAFNQDMPLLLYGNGGEDSNFLYRSIITKWDTSVPSTSAIRSFNFNKGVFNNFSGYQGLGLDLRKLYSIAYIPEDNDTDPDNLWWPSVILNVKDTSLFTGSFEEEKNLYNYSIMMPKSITSLDNMRAVLKKELAINFNFEVEVEKRMMPCLKLKLVSNDYHDKVKSKGDSTYFNDIIHNVSFVAKNLPVKELLRWLAFPGKAKHILINETGIDNVDITWNCIATASLEDIRKSLNGNGLDIVESNQEMNVAVIYDKKNETGKSQEDNFISIIKADDVEALKRMVGGHVHSYANKYRLLLSSISYRADKCFNFLIANDVNVNFIADLNDRPPLMEAIRVGDLIKVKKLVEKGANAKYAGMLYIKNPITNLYEKKWMTPIGYAAMAKQPAIAEYLKSIGAK